MKLQKLVVVGLLGAFIASCSSGPEKRVTQNGMEISVIEAGTEQIEPGLTMLLSFNVKTATDSLLIDTSLDGMPRPTRKVDSIWYANKGGVEEVLFNLNKGDSVMFKITADKIYGPATPPQLKPDDLVTVNLKVIDAMSMDDFRVYREKLLEEKSKGQLAIDVAIIDAYLEENGIDAVKLESGLRYIITKEGEGENVKSGQVIRANYAGYVLNGEYFDTSIEEVAKEQGLYTEGRSYAPFETAVGVGAVIKGWDEGFQLLNQGSKATFYIPSTLAYGPRARSAQIGPNSILVFDVELVEVKSND